MLDSWSEGLGVDPGGSSGRIYYSTANFLCGLFSSVFIPPSRYCSSTYKTRSFYQKCEWQVTPKLTSIHVWPNKVGVGWLCCSGIRETSSYATRQRIFGYTLLSPLSHCEAIFGLKEWNLCRFSPRKGEAQTENLPLPLIILIWEEKLAMQHLSKRHAPLG